MQVLHNQSNEPIRDVIFSQNRDSLINSSENISSSTDNTKDTSTKETKLNPKVDEVVKDKRRDVSSDTNYTEDSAVQMMVMELQARDMEVRAHESAHMSAGANTGGASFTYQVGPNGKLYAIGGEVPIDLSSGNTLEETISKMQNVKAAALAPSSPSPQDLKVAASAGMVESQARSELNLQKSEENKEADTNTNTDSESSEKIDNKDTSQVEN